MDENGKSVLLMHCSGNVHPDQTETHHVVIDGKAIDVTSTCLAGHGRPYGLYTLRMSARYASVDDAERPEDVVDGVAPARVFVYRRPVRGKWGLDEFVCVADALDMDEVPPDYAEADAERRGVAFYRTAELELCFRSSDMLYECRDSMFTGTCS